MRSVGQPAAPRALHHDARRRLRIRAAGECAGARQEGGRAPGARGRGGVRNEGDVRLLLDNGFCRRQPAVTGRDEGTFAPTAIKGLGGL